ncbi:hypothetical protein J4444_00640 [Candidatus Woesearchaeota archaeon]|nr:hypothetical protein [Candidatus Woesearchaeota archaeon]
MFTAYGSHLPVISGFTAEITHRQCEIKDVQDLGDVIFLHLAPRSGEFNTTFALYGPKHYSSFLEESGVVTPRELIGARVHFYSEPVVTENVLTFRNYVSPAFRTP